jgi:predicted DNA-binding transcriptional regulator YafY
LPTSVFRSWHAGYKLPPLMFSDDEALAVVLGLLAGRRAGLVSTASATESASAKVRRVLPTALGHRLEALLATTEFTAADRSVAPPGTDVLLTLADAARRQQPVAIAYVSWRGQASERILHPYGLVFHSGRWYVTGADSARGEVRTFRLDRITQVALSPGSFDIPEGFDRIARVLSGLADVQYPHEASILLHTTLDAVRDRPPASIAQVTDVDGAVRLRLRANRRDWIAAVLAWLGCTFVVEYPEELRAEVRSLAARMETCAAVDITKPSPS